MAINTKAVKSRINSVKNTKKITKAMEMIAAVKMRKAVLAAVQTRAYAKLANDMLTHLGGLGKSHPLTYAHSVVDEETGEEEISSKELFIIITSNKGLCGGYNSKVIKEFGVNVKNKKNIDIEVIGVGQKGTDFVRRSAIKVVESYQDLGESPVYEDIVPISRTIIDAFTSGTYAKVSIIFTNYISGLLQEVETKQLLPITQEQIDRLLDSAGAEGESDLGSRGKVEFDTNEAISEEQENFEFEPKKGQILNYVLPLLVEIQLYQALLESSASEQSSRMIAMKNATEAASDMIEDLNREFNKGRQAAITQEVAEIVSGALALEKKKKAKALEESKSK